MLCKNLFFFKNFFWRWNQLLFITNVFIKTKPSFSLSFKNSKLVALQLIIIFSNKSFFTNILLGWNVIIGVNSFLYFYVNESLDLSEIARKKSLVLIQKYWLLFRSLIASKSHFWQLPIIMSNIFILYLILYLNDTKYSIIFHFYIISAKKKKCFLMTLNTQ